MLWGQQSEAPVAYLAIRDQGFSPPFRLDRKGRDAIMVPPTSDATPDPAPWLTATDEQILRFVDNLRCICPPNFCFGVPGDSDDNPQICRACMVLDVERDCLRGAEG